MYNDQYSQAFRSLGIAIDPLPSHYTPEEFGRRLLASTQTERGVSYAASTDYVEVPQKASDIIKDKQ